jgi:hypothetical protein
MGNRWRNEGGGGSVPPEASQFIPVELFLRASPAGALLKCLSLNFTLFVALPYAHARPCTWLIVRNNLLRF